MSERERDLQRRIGLVESIAEGHEEDAAQIREQARRTTDVIMKHALAVEAGFADDEAADFRAVAALLREQPRSAPQVDVEALAIEIGDAVNIHDPAFLATVREALTRALSVEPPK